MAEQTSPTPRIGRVSRKTPEVDIELGLNIDGTGKYELKLSGINLEEPSPGFYLDHLLQQQARQGHMDVEGVAKVGYPVSFHHLGEDLAIVQATALKEALGDKRGIVRQSSGEWPFDTGELVRMSIDLSGRGYCELETGISDPYVDDIVYHYFSTFCREAGITLNGSGRGRLIHHIAELFGKLSGKLIYEATRYSGHANIPSTKETLSDH